ncbi:hypothetical protein ABZ424_18815, partial [Streptomyces sp. NPDC005790]
IEYGPVAAAVDRGQRSTLVAHLGGGGRHVLGVARADGGSRGSGEPLRVGALLAGRLRADVERQVGQGQPFRADVTSPAYTSMAEAMRVAYPGEEMQSSGMGGSIPLCNTLAALYPQAEILLIGLSEPEARIHAVNESVSPEELERLSVAEALFLRNYAESKKV